MAKNDIVKKRDESFVEEFDFSEFMDSDEDDSMMAGFAQGIIEASNHQMLVALELTKIVDKNTDKMDANKVFSTFKQASQVVADSSPLKTLWEKLSENN